MIMTKKQLRKAIVSNKYIPFADHDQIFSIITSKKRWMWETELIRWERLYLKCHHKNRAGVLSASAEG